MKVSDYMPKLYDNNLEMLNIINSEEYELENNLKKDIDNSFADTFAIKATEKGISNFEEIFNIKPNLYTEDLEFRRERIINRLVSKIPFTERYLISRLNVILGEGNWTYEIDYNNYTLVINSIIPGRSWYNELQDFLRTIIPVNIDWTVIIYAASWDLVRQHFETWDDLYNANLTWQELADAEWLNS